MFKNRIKIKNTILIFLLILIFTLNAAVFSEAKTVIDNKILFLGNKDLAPIIYNEQGEAKGIIVDIAEEITAKINYEAEIKTSEWTEAQNQLQKGKVDALLQINPNLEREKKFDFSDELLRSEFSIFKHNDSKFIHNIDDLKNKTIAVEADGYPHQILKKYPKINLRYIQNWKSAFESLNNKKIDAVIADRWIGEYELAQSGIREIVLVEEPIDIKYSRIAVKKGNDSLLNLINQGITELKADGSLDNILLNWQDKQVIYITQARLNRIYLIAFIIIIALVFLISFYWIRKLKRLNTGLEEKVKERTKKLKEANQELEKLSIMDGLTGIYNKRYFDKNLKKFWNISLREKKPVALIMIDIDDFKAYNDEFGHLAGDQCLKKVAEIIKNCAQRSSDITARFGGEEFVILAVNSKEVEAFELAEKIRKKVTEQSAADNTIKKEITISLGCAALIPDNLNDFEQLIKLADQALYKAKADGKNKTVKASLLK